MKILINRQVIIASFVAGCIFGAFFKVVENLTGSRVYTLLLNVDYIPIIKNFRFPEVIEFVFHLIISWLITAVLCAIRNKYKWNNSMLMRNSVFIQIFIGCMLFPTTIFSKRTPIITDYFAFSWWLIGHVVYGALIGLLLKRKNS
jgi:flagellar biosynthesis protein FliR